MAKKRRKRPQSSWLSDQKQVEKLIAYVFGIVFVITILALAILLPEPTAFQYVAFRIVLSLAAAGVASMIPGFIEINISNVIRAGGALAVFVLVYFYNPASLVVENPWITEVDQLRGNLGNIEGIWERLDESDLPCERVRNEASDLGNRFYSIDDKHFDDKVGLKIEKYRYAQYAYLMASDVECDEDKAKEYAQQSIQYGDTALTFIEEAKQLAGDYGQDLRAWLDSDYTADRIYFHNALGHAILHRLNVPQEAEKVTEALDNIRRQYYAESAVSLEKNRILELALNNSSADSESPENLRLMHPCLLTCGVE